LDTIQLSEQNGIVQKGRMSL